MTRKALFDAIRPFANGYKKDGQPDALLIGMVDDLADYLALPPEKPAEAVSVPKPIEIPGGLTTPLSGAPAASGRGFRLGERSEQRLAGVHPDLVNVVRRAIQITDVDFAVLEGLRSLARQKQLVASGASRTMNSRHLTGHAVDLGATVNGEVRWDWPLYHRLAKAVKQAAKDVGVPIEWGGDWKSFKDGPHWQIPFKEYPK